MSPDSKSFATAGAVEDVRLSARQLERAYVVNRARHLAVRGVSLDVGTGRSIGIVGESGSGKSTLAKLLAGLDRPSAGHVEYRGQALTDVLDSGRGRLGFRRDVQLVAQDTTSSFDPTRTIRHAVRAPAMRLLGMSASQADRAVDEVLDRLEVPVALASRRPHEVSGGQRQRCAIARALIVRPRVLICDEVVSALDVSVQGGVLNLLKDYVEESGSGIVFVSHGLPATAFLTSEIVVMFQGEIVEHAPTEEIVTRPTHPYTKHLLTAAGWTGAARSAR